MGGTGSGETRRVAVLPRVVEDLAKDHAKDTWVIIPRSTDLDQGWREITYEDLGNAVDGFARWVEQELGPGSGEAVAYIGINDMRYGVVVTGLIKSGYKPMLPSPRNSKEGQQSLLQTVKCKAVLCSENVEPAIQTIRDAAPDLAIRQIRSFDESREQGFLSGPYKGCYSDAEDEQALILHTSGSTGLPKPIYITNGGLATIGLLKLLPAPEGHHNAHEALLQSDRSLLAVCPFFHAMGAIVMSRSLFCKGPLVLMPPNKPPNAQLIIEVINQTNPWSGISPPSMLEQIAEAPGGLDALAKLEYSFYGGAPLVHETGEKINKVTNIVPMIGSTEAGLIPNQLPVDKRDWEYFEWSLGSGVVMEPAGEGLFEMVIKRDSDRKYQAIFHTFPQLEKYRTKDLYQAHPSKPNLWLYKGRKDDVLVLNNGEKFNPVGFEKAMEAHPIVNGAVVVGQGRFQTGLLIEPEWKLFPEKQDPEQLIDQLWPTIEKANVEAPAHARVWRSKVAIAKRNKPFKRAAKGSIMRRATVDLYQPEIDALYSDEAGDDELGKLEPGSDLPTVKDFLRKAFKLKALPIPRDAPDDADIFSFGVDSLQILSLSSILSHACGGGKEAKVAPRTIYSHPTIESLAKYLQDAGDSEGNGEQTVNHEENMERLVKKYTKDLPTAPSPPLLCGPNNKHNVVLTGSTGSLGNYILEELILTSDVAHVFCLNRSADAESRQRQTFDSRGTHADFSKVTFLHTDFSKDRFGLPKNVYNNLLDKVDIFIHNAWTVDFNKSLETYEGTHIAGTRRCVDFSLQSKHRAHIVFISSIASVGNWLSHHSLDEEVPETLPDDYGLPLPQGYGESKHVASRILASAAARSSVPSTIIRAGQLAGPSKPGIEWNRHEWLPSIVLSSKAMRMIPERLGNQDMVDWVPVDLAAKVVVETAIARTGQGRAEEQTLGVAHLVNPRTVSWTELVPKVKDTLERQIGSKVQVVPFRDWLDKLKSKPASEADKVPGIKLVDFYEGLASDSGGLPHLATSRSQKMSRSLQEMRPVSGGLMDMWTQRWIAQE